MSVKPPIGDQWEQVAREWREAGQHLKSFGETLMRAFQSGWQDQQAEADFTKLTEEMRASAKRLESALRVAREAVGWEEPQAELAEARARTIKAAEDTQRMVAAAVETFSATLAQLSGQAKAWKDHQKPHIVKVTREDQEHGRE